MVEIFEQPEAIHLRVVGVGFGLGDTRRHLDRYLLEPDRGLER
jgi:hypothetical protein